MRNRISISAIASFLFGNGVAGLLAYFGNSLPALISSILSTIVGIALGVWWFISSRKDTKQDITTESIRHDLTRHLETKLWFQFIGFIVLILIFTAGVQVFIYRETTYVEQTRPILSLDPNIEGVTYNAQSYTANITIEYTLSNLRDKPSYQNQFRYAAFRDIDLNNITVLPDQYITNPIYKTANHQATEDYSIQCHPSPVGGEISIITYSNIKYADGTTGRVRWYTDTWWYALTMYFDANGQLVKVDNEEVDPSLIPKYKVAINSKFPNK